MNEYEFTLKFSLNKKDITEDQIIDILYNNGCDDALVGLGKKDRLAFNFIRESESAEKAIFSAILDIKKALPDAKLVEASPDFVGLTDVADILGFSRQYMRKIMEKYIEEFPLPVHEGNLSIWHLFNILDWVKKRDIYEVKNYLLDISKTNMIINLNKYNLNLSIPKKVSLLLK